MGLTGSGLEVGVAQGINSWNMIRSWQPSSWMMVDPVESEALKETLSDLSRQKSTRVTYIKGKSLDQSTLSYLKSASFDFVYLDAAHDYESVAAELEVFYNRVRPGGVFAGHDYCTNRTIDPQVLLQQHVPPQCSVYTGVRTGGGGIKTRGAPVADMYGVVEAVLEWVRNSHPGLIVHFTRENFTRESLAAYGLEYENILTKTRNPSWWVEKPMM
jgi:hypothetical protein